MQENGKYEDDAVEERDELAEALAGIFGQLRKSLLAGDVSAISDAPNGTAHGPQLYDGTSGIAFFLAAYYFATKDPGALDLALRSVAQLRFTLKQTPAVAENGMGGLAGVGSLPYAFSQLATWLKMPELFACAREVAAAITPDQIMAEEHLDVMRGCAGTLLALLAFIEEGSAMGMDSGNAHDLALLCGRRLLEKRVSSDSGPRAWPEGDSLPPSGFAYGAAGIAYALIRLFQYTGQEEFRDAAIEGFAFERARFTSELETWPDPCTYQPLKMASWREGAPGVALAILGSMAAIDSHAVRHDLEQVLSITRQLPESPLDDLSRGNFGRVEIMNIAGSRLGRLQLSAYAHHMATHLLARAATAGFRFHLHDSESNGNPENNSSLFLGLAGVGYTLLRLIYPDLFPSVLLLQTTN